METACEALPREKHESTRDYALRCLEHNIIRITLYPGQHLSEARISEALGISRTPVREAFFDLSKAGVVEIFPQKGTRVALIDTDLVEDARFMRLAVERAVVALACERRTAADITLLRENYARQLETSRAQDVRGLLDLDNGMHDLFFRIAGKEFSLSLIKKLRVHFDRVRILNLMNHNFETSMKEHLLLIDALEAGDGGRAAAIMDTHLSRVNECLPALEARYSEYFRN